MTTMSCGLDRIVRLTYGSRLMLHERSALKVTLTGITTEHATINANFAQLLKNLFNLQNVSILS